MDTRSICPACNAMYDRSVFVCVRCGTGLLEIPDAPLLSGSTLDMRYDIEGVVGTGGMGTVYRARQRGMEREVAIKILHPRYAHEPRAVKRFFREAQAASKLIHPHIVTVYDFGRAAEGHLYMVMELLEGFTLGDLIHYRAPLPPALALAILTQICEALEEAHRQRLVHRDLKPDNILLTATEDGLWAKVLDFGIARVVRDQPESLDGSAAQGGLERNQSTVEIAGTPAYMSPEQILGREPDPRSDLYSLGIILFEMLTRQRPFDDPSSVTLCMKQLNEEPPRLSSMRAEPGASAVSVSEPLERLVRQLLEKKPEARPQRALDVRVLAGKCPESSFPFSVPDLGGVQLAPRALGNKTTRAEPLPRTPAADVDDAADTIQLAPVAAKMAPARAASPSAAVATVAASMGPPVATVGAPRATQGAMSALRADAKAAVGDATSVLGGAAAANAASAAAAANAAAAAAANAARRPAVELVAPRRDAKKASREAAGAVALIAAEHAGALATGELARWLAGKEAAGWEVQREERRALVKVPGETGEAMRVAARELTALQERALAQNLGLRVGLAPIEDAHVPNAVDLARRLAAATTHGQVAVSAPYAGKVGLGVRPQTTIFMPNGQPLECAVVRRPAQDERGRDDDGDDAGGLLWGRGLQLRRLGQIADEALRQGPTAALVQGARGMGKSAMLNAFLAGRRAVRVRVSPLAAAAPGHGLAQLVAAALELPPLRGKVAELDRLAGLDLGDRDRELIELVLLDRPVVEPPRTRALARLVVEALARKAGEESLVVAIDDAHLLDRASREVLAQVHKLAAGRPWCFVATARWVKPETLLASEARVDLRPLGLRAMNQLAEALQIAPRQRHGLIAAAQGNPLALGLLTRYTGGQEPPTQIHQLGEGLLPWLLTGLLRQADPRDAEQAWLGATLGEGAALEEPLTQAARLHLEKELPKDLAAWLGDRLRREGPWPESLGAALGEASLADATRRAQRSERLGLYKLAALELETALPLTAQAERAQSELEVANYRAKAGDIKGAIDSFQASARAGGERRPTALLRFARTLLDLGDSERAADALDWAQGAIETRQKHEGRADGHVRSLGEWLVLRAKTTLLRGDLTGAGTALQRARDLADQVARTDARVSRGLQALVQETRAELALATGDREAARTNFRQARDAFRDLGQHADALRCLVALGEVELQMRELRRAADTFRAATRLAATAGLVREEILAEVGLGETEIALGELDEGGQRLRTAFRRVSAEEEEGVLGARAALGMAHAMLARRLFADVFRYSERARALSKSPGIAARAGLVEAQAWLGQDQPRKAHKALQDAYEAARASSDALLVERVRLARAAAHAGEGEGAAEAVA